TMATDVEVIKEDLSSLKHSMQKLNEHVSEMESHISNIEDDMHLELPGLEAITMKMDSLIEKLDDLENRSCQNNIRIIGVPEGAKAGNMKALVKNLITGSLNMVWDPQFEIERAHRTLGPYPGLDQEPCHIIVTFLRFTAREAILKGARVMENAMYDDKRIFFFPDLSKNVIQKRAKFSEIKRKLAEENEKYIMQYPATLHFTWKGVVDLQPKPQRGHTHNNRPKKLKRDWVGKKYYTCNSFSSKKGGT
uniref:L1 transposable element RRM domain-containing protein n=1 Tax=Latimeria chalumnae TaxID=7897 RepID=H3AKH8_LATCH